MTQDVEIVFEDCDEGITDTKRAFDDVVERLNQVREILNNQILERKQEIDGILITIMADSSCLFLGDPGTAKTQMVKYASYLFGLVSFDILLGETTKPEQVFGPTNIPALAQGKLYTSTKGYAPECEVLFLDEVFKANGTVLNPLLWLINEKQYRNGDLGVIDCPIKAVFAASNELPNDDSLGAFFDRLVLRYEVQPLKSVQNISKMINNFLHHPAKPQPIFNTHLFDVLRGFVKQVVIPEELITTLYNIKCQLERVHKITISDRRLNKCIRLVQAQAVLNGRLKAELSDFEILQHCLWDTPETKSKIQSTVMSFVNTSIPQLIAYSDMCTNLYNTAFETGNMKRALAKLKKLYAKVKPYTGATAENVVNDIKSKFSKIAQVCKQREQFVLYRVKAGSNVYYQVDNTTASLWTYKQMRACEFRQRRKGNYWYSSDSKDVIASRISQTLGVQVVIKKL